MFHYADISCSSEGKEDQIILVRFVFESVFVSARL